MSISKLKPISLAEIRKRIKPVRDVNAEHEKGLGALERIAVQITDRVGTMGFFLLIFTWTVLWLGWNMLAPKRLQFDPPTAFVFWLFISNMIQIFLMPLIMIGQNLQGRHAELRAESDFEVNVKAEKEIEVILHHLEFQNAMILALLKKLAITQEEVLAGMDNPDSRAGDDVKAQVKSCGGEDGAT
jgi:uncharacterized membrane protein